MPSSGALLIDKPSGPTSHDVVAFTRRLLKTPRVGHTGTLDPLATGLLVLLVGHATRLSQFLVSDEKEYIADVRLGIATPTYDAQSRAEGVGGARADGRWPMDTEVDAALARFRGTFLQMPPAFSAKKVAGVRAYEHARKSEAVDLQPVAVTVRQLDLLPPSADSQCLEIADPASDGGSADATLLRLRVVASSGFYVRSLAHDLGQALGCGAHLEGLRRTRAGRFRVDEAATLDVLDTAGAAAGDRLIPLNVLLGDLPAVTLTPEGLRRAGNGNSLAPGHVAAGFPATELMRTRILGPDGEVLAVAERRADGLLHPLLVLR
jgi:tRNA pseudouridine55 synthase